MKKLILIIILIITFTSCKNELDCCVNIEPVTITLKFTHLWDETPVNKADFNTFKFTTENGDVISIERLRYLISDIKIGESSKDYQLINIGDNSGLEISFYNVSMGSKQLKFRFGLADTDNLDGAYQDLNSANFSVPLMLGGGYHFMQFDGKFQGSTTLQAPFNYHVIRAASNSQSNPWDNLPDTSFLVNLGTVEIYNNATIQIKVNIAEWFKNPNSWDLDVLNTALMPNFKAQQLMSANGKTVFSLGTITQ